MPVRGDQEVGIAGKTEPGKPRQPQMSKEEVLSRVSMPRGTCA